METGTELIAEERREQIEKHLYRIGYDVKFNTCNQLILAANILSQKDIPPFAVLNKPYGWDINIWKKMLDKPYKERLIIAGALIAAEIDRLNAIENN